MYSGCYNSRSFVSTAIEHSHSNHDVSQKVSILYKFLWTGTDNNRWFSVLWWIWTWSPMLCEQYGTHASVTIIFLCFWPQFMMTSSNSNISALLAFCAGNSPVTGGFPWRSALMLSLVCAWANGWASNQDAGVLRRHHAYYDVTNECGMWSTRVSPQYRWFSARLQ